MEKIKCAANKYMINGESIIIEGKAHFICQNEAISRGYERLDVLRDDQGFVTTTGRFIDRKEALKIALDNDQVVDKRICGYDILFSEDLRDNN